MEFGIGIDTHVNKWDLVRYAEELGYDRAWIPDSQMIWSDCYAVLALAAIHTRRIKLGTGVAIAGTRIAPVTAHQRNDDANENKRVFRISLAAIGPGGRFAKPNIRTYHEFHVSLLK